MLELFVVSLVEIAWVVDEGVVGVALTVLRDKLLRDKPNHGVAIRRHGAV